MKKKISLFLVVTALLCGLAACAGITHCKECDDEVYEDGYCKYHYEINVAKEKIDEIGKDIMDMFGE